MSYFSTVTMRDMKYNNSKLNYSSFWADNSIWDDDSDDLNKVEKKSNDLMKLMSYKKSISNFVNIVTGKNIPVTFDGRGDSYTDGKEVVISAKLDDKEFDPVVGLALHEGSHISLTDFDILQKLIHGYLPNSIDIDFLMKKYGQNFGVDSYSELIQELKINKDFFNNLKNLLNYVEDRRIDNSIYTSAPGYRGYYESMYDKYFHSKSIDKGLQSSEYRTEDWESYMFRIINLTNSNRDLGALKGLREIWSLLDLKNISRLKDTNDSLELAGEILMVLEKAIPLPQQSDDKSKGNGEGESDDSNDTNGESPMSGDSEDTPQGGSPMKASGEGKTSESDGDGEADGQTDQPTEGGTSSTPNKNGAGGQHQPLNERQKKMLDNAIDKQKKFLDGEITKKKISKADKKKIDTLDKADIQSEVTGKGLQQGYYGGYQSNGVQTYIIRNFNKNLVDSNVIEMLTTWGHRTDQNQKNINAGISLGVQLGKKLKTRNEERVLTTPRMKSGKLNGRMLHEIGFGNFDIFDQVNIDTSTPSVIHISIDASSSMSGDKWNKTQTAAVAIAKAASMTDNIDVVISYRSIYYNAGSGYSNVQPLMLMAYDSRKDKFSKIQTLFKHIIYCGTTPEGLCFEAVLKELTSTKNGTESYFINFSDGWPGFDNKEISYGGNYAVEHTAAQVKKIQQAGVQVLSYFISDGYFGSSNETFSKMYGKGAEFIDVNNVTQLAKTLNKKFEVKI